MKTKKIVLAALVCLPLHAAGAAEIVRAGDIVRSGGERLEKITLSGKIAPGDAERLAQLVTMDGESIVSLRSNGGDYREGLAMANLLRTNHVRTIVEDGASCYSACALTFLGGSKLDLEGFEPGSGNVSTEEAVVPARSIAPTAHLGFHAPFLNVPPGSFTRERVEESYDHAIRTVTDFVRATRRFQISPEVAADMMTPQRSELYVVGTVRDLSRVGVELEDVPAPKKLTVSMVRNLCVNGLAWNFDNETAASVTTHMREVIDDIHWQADRATHQVKTDYFGPGREVRRTAWPMGYAAEGQGYLFCVVDHTTEDGKANVSLRGYLIDDDRMGAGVFGFGLGEDGAYDVPDIEAGIAAGERPVSEPAGDKERSPESRWALVPEETPVDRVTETLDNYQVTEPAL